MNKVGNGSRFTFDEMITGKLKVRSMYMFFNMLKILHIVNAPKRD